MIDKQKELNQTVIDYIKKYDIDIFNVENHIQEFMFGYSTTKHIDTGFRTVTLQLKPKQRKEIAVAKKTASKKAKKVTKTNKKK